MLSELTTRLARSALGASRVMNDQYAETTSVMDRGAAHGVLATLVRRKLALFGMAVILLTSLLAVAAPLIAPYPYEEQLADGISDDGAPLPPNLKYLLGTDLLGRDLMSRLIWGARTSLVIGVAANGASVLIGSFIGIVAGFFGGWLGALLMRFTDLMMAFPATLLAILLAALFNPSLWIVALVIAMVNWVQVARIVYTETRSLSRRDFVEAEWGLGAGMPRILVRHILPHLVPTLLVFGTLGISTSVLLEATLSFLGIGVQPPIPSWGNIVAENQSYFGSAPWIVFLPGAAIILLALSFNLVGDALRDILDPTQKGRH
jgi:peptide/nickel transport system permease protein